MEQKYRDMFDEVHASDRLQQEVQNMTKQERQEVRRRISKTTLIAAIIAALLAGTALAASVPGVKLWFDRQWEETSGGKEMAQEQERAIDSLTHSVNVSSASRTDAPEMEDASGEAEVGQASAVGETTVSEGEAQATVPGTVETPAGSPKVILDSVTVGEERLWMMLKVSGEYPAGRSYMFEKTYLEGGPQKELSELGIQLGGSIKYSTDGSTVTEDGNLLLLVRYTAPSGSGSLLKGGHFKLHLENLLMDRELVCEGQWDLEFDLAATESQPALTVENVPVPATDTEGREITLTFQQIRVHATGVQMFTGVENAGFTLWWDTALVMADGTEVRSDGAHSGWESVAENSRWVTSYTWCVPVDLSRAVALRLGDTRIPLR